MRGCAELIVKMNWHVSLQEDNHSKVKDSFIVEEAYLEWKLCGITFSFEKFCFLFVATCCLARWRSNSHIYTGTADDELLFIGVYLGSVITLELDMNLETIDFAIERKLVGRITRGPKVVYFGIYIFFFFGIISFLLLLLLLFLFVYLLFSRCVGLSIRLCN
jgi:hypothetical protein